MRAIIDTWFAQELENIKVFLAYPENPAAHLCLLKTVDTLVFFATHTGNDADDALLHFFGLVLDACLEESPAFIVMTKTAASQLRFFREHLDTFFSKQSCMNSWN